MVEQCSVPRRQAFLPPPRITVPSLETALSVLLLEIALVHSSLLPRFLLLGNATTYLNQTSVVALGKHLAGYGGAVGGLNGAPLVVGERQLR